MTSHCSLIKKSSKLIAILIMLCLMLSVTTVPASAKSVNDFSDLDP